MMQLDHVVKLQSFDGTQPCPVELQGILQSINEDANGEGVITEQDNHTLQRQRQTCWKKAPYSAGFSNCVSQLISPDNDPSREATAGT